MLKLTIAPLQPCSTADLVGEYAGALLPALKIAEKAAKRPLRPKWREGLTARIKGAIMAYDGTQFMTELASKFTLHKIAGPLAKVIEMLKHEGNIDEVLTALGADPRLMTCPGREAAKDLDKNLIACGVDPTSWGWLSPDRESVDRAIAEYRAMLRSLHKVADNLPPAPAKQRGRPKAHDLHQLVNSLADVWEVFTGQEFTQLWHKEKGKWKPISAAAQFAHAVISVVDPKRLPSVPEVTEQIVKRRRKATSDK